MKQSLVTARPLRPRERRRGRACRDLIPSLRNSQRRPEALPPRGMQFHDHHGGARRRRDRPIDVRDVGRRRETDAFRIVSRTSVGPVSAILRRRAYRSVVAEKVLDDHKIRLGQGLFDVPVSRSAAPGMSLDRILRRGRSRAADPRIPRQHDKGIALPASSKSRAHQGHPQVEPRLKALLTPEPVNHLPLDSGLPGSTPADPDAGSRGVWQFFCR